MIYALKVWIWSTTPKKKIKIILGSLEPGSHPVPPGINSCLLSAVPCSLKIDRDKGHINWRHKNTRFFFFFLQRKNQQICGLFLTALSLNNNSMQCVGLQTGIKGLSAWIAVAKVQLKMQAEEWRVGHVTFTGKHYQMFTHGLDSSRYLYLEKEEKIKNEVRNNCL